MSEKNKKPTIRWLEKLKNVKHIEIYVAVIFVVILLLIYLSNTKTKDKKNVESSNDVASVTAYIDKMEQDLEKSLSSISGISNVNVMITLNINQFEVENSQISMSKFPEIKGVLVTAKGVNNTTNKMKVLHAIQAVIDVTNGNIEILSSE